MIKLTPEIVASAYDFVRLLPPFSRWQLPPSTGVRFSITGHRDRHGDYSDWHIRVSRNAVETSQVLLITVAHEATHLAQDIARTASADAEHNADWRRRWRAACRRHGWDSKAFGPAP